MSVQGGSKKECRNRPLDIAKQKQPLTRERLYCIGKFTGLCL
jgi:hypothetical protein